jgi:hypothetical protein
MSVARQQIPNTRQWTGWKVVFSARSAPMVTHATTDTVTEERCSLCGPSLDVIRRIVSQCSAVDYSGVKCWLVSS